MLMILYLLAIVIILLWLITSPFYWRSKKVPYITPLPILGSCLPLFKYGLHDYIIQLYKKFPGEKYFGIHLLTRPALYIKDPKLIQRIFVKDFDYFTSHGFYGNQDRDPSGSNLFFIHGQQWKEIRQKFTPFFTPAKIKSAFPYFNNSIGKLFKLFDKSIENDEAIKMDILMHYTSTDIMIQTLFGIEADTFGNENSILRIIAGKTMTLMFTLRMVIGLVSPKLFDLLKFTVFEHEVNNTITDIVKKTIELRKKEITERNDLLQGILELQNNKPSSDEKYFPDYTRVPKYDIDELTSQLIVLFEGGVETSSTTLSFLFYELAIHQEIQEKCREEINSIVPHGTEINLEHINKFTYLNAAIKEALRLYSPFIMINRECTKTYKVPDSDLTIEKGTFIITSPISSHLDEEYFTDPHQFIPERFLNKEEKQQGTFYYPFGEGPKTCIGMNFGLFAIKLIGARILQRYMITTCSKTQIPIKYSKFMFLTRTADGIWLKLKEI